MSESTESTNYLLTVSQYAEKIGKSKQSIYNRIKRGTLKTTTVDNQTFIDLNNIDLKVDLKVEQQEQHNQPQVNQPLTTIENTENKEIKSLKKENKKLRKIIDKRDLEIKDLLERIISIENSQKDEIIKQQELKHQELKMYMEFIQKQSENILPPQATQATETPTKEYKHTHDDIIDADIEKDKKKKKKNKKNK